MADKRGVLMTEDFARRAGVAVKRLEAEPRFTTGPVGVGSPAFGRPIENWVQLVSTTIAANIATGSQTVTPADMSGIEVGVNLTIGPPGTVEVVAVTAVTDTTFTATFANTHTGPDIVCDGALTGDYMPGVWSQHDVSDDTWEIQLASVFISAPNGETLETDTRYRAVAAGEFDGTMVFDAIVTSSGSTVAFSGAFVNLASNFTMTTGTTYTLDFDTEQYDTDAYHDAGTNPSRLTVPEDGYYQCGAFSGIANPAGVGIFQTFLTKNGSGKVSAQALTGTALAQVYQTLLAPVFHCVAGDYFQLLVQQTSGGNATLFGGTAAGTQFWIMKVG